MEKSYVYCFRLGEFVKIGMSVDPYKRLKQLQTSLPHDLVPLYMVECMGARNLESDVHSILAHLKEKREWFKYTHEVDDLFKSLGAENINPIPNADKVAIDKIDAMYSQYATQDLIYSDLDTIRKILELDTEENEWVESTIKKWHKGRKFKGMIGELIAEIINDVADECPFYDRSNKATHLDYRFKYITENPDYEFGDNGYYHKSERYFLGTIYNKHGKGLSAAWQSLIDFAKKEGRFNLDMLNEVSQKLAFDGNEVAANCFYDHTYCYSTNSKLFTTYIQSKIIE